MSLLDPNSYFAPTDTDAVRTIAPAIQCAFPRTSWRRCREIAANIEQTMVAKA